AEAELEAARTKTVLEREKRRLDDQRSFLVAGVEKTLQDACSLRDLAAGCSRSPPPSDSSPSTFLSQSPSLRPPPPPPPLTKRAAHSARDSCHNDCDNSSVRAGLGVVGSAATTLRPPPSTKRAARSTHDSCDNDGDSSAGVDVRVGLGSVATTPTRL
ncbi:unnamed protein product, partial [Laminaria digitata]